MAVLKSGSKGTEVIKLQLLLNRYLKPSPKLKADGDFGNNTKIALMQFQKDKQLVADGVAGKNTWTALGVTPTVAAVSNIPTINAPWYDIADAERGISEISGADKHNKRILEYHASTTLGAKTDEIAWCSSFVNWVMIQAGNNGTNNALAKSWATWGKKVTSPSKGVIVIIKRKNKTSDASTGSSTGYHVGFYESSTDTTIKILGGNQNNKVKSSNFYLRSYEIIAYRKPIRIILGRPLRDFSNYC